MTVTALLPLFLLGRRVVCHWVENRYFFHRTFYIPSLAASNPWCCHCLLWELGRWIPRCHASQVLRWREFTPWVRTLSPHHTWGTALSGELSFQAKLTCEFRFCLHAPHLRKLWAILPQQYGHLPLFLGCTVARIWSLPLYVLSEKIHFFLIY